MKKFIAIVILCLTACTAPGPKFTSLPPPSDGSSILYFMKTKSMTGLDTIFTLDGASIGRIDADQYSWVKVRPGTYVVRTEDEASPYILKMKVNKLNLQIEIEPNKEYYIERLDEAAAGSRQYNAILRVLPKNMAINRISNLNMSASQASGIVSGAPRVMPKPQKDKATVFFYRSSKNSSGIDLDIVITANGKEICSLGSQMYAFKYLNEGEYTMRATWPALEKPLFDSQYKEKSINISLAKGKTYYVNYKAIQHGLYDIETSFAEEGEEKAMANIARSSYQEGCKID